MMAGLNPEEKSQLGLDGLSIKDLNYLNIGDTRQDELSDAQRFADWKSNLAVLGNGWGNLYMPIYIHGSDILISDKKFWTSLGMVWFYLKFHAEFNYGQVK